MADITQNYLFLFLCFLSPLLLILFFNRPTSNRRNHPPRPPGLPFIGHLHLVGDFFHKSMQNLATQYGSIFSLRLGFADCVVVSTAPLANEIFKTHDLDFGQHPKLAFADEVPYGNCGFFSSPYGDYWRFIKKLSMTELLSSGQLERSRVVREEELARFLRGLLESAEKKEVVNMGVELMKLTNNSLCRIAMSTRCSEKGDEAEKVRGLLKTAYETGSKVLIGEVLGPLNKVMFWFYGKQSIDLTERFDEFLEKMLKKHEDDQIGETRENEDLMDILLRVCRDGKAEAKMMTRNHLKAFYMF